MYSSCHLPVTYCLIFPIISFRSMYVVELTASRRSLSLAAALASSFPTDTQVAWDPDNRDIGRAESVDADVDLHHQCRPRVGFQCFRRFRSAEEIGKDGESLPLKC